MAEDKPENFQKTEEPTQKRLDDARKKGQVPVSREVNTWLMLTAGAIVIAFFLPETLSALSDVMSYTLQNAFAISADKAGLGNHSWIVMQEVLKATSGPFLVLFLFALFTGIIQNGVILSLESMKPKLSKISPVTGIKRMFSFKNFFEFLKGIFKIVVISFVCIVIAIPFYKEINSLPFLMPYAVLSKVSTFSLTLLSTALSVLLVLALVDLVYQRFNNTKELRMTKQEVKDEFKNTEGDPHVKARLRQIRNERARQRMMQAMQKADVVITNPTHFSVALAYDQTTMAAPVMIAKGVDDLAMRIRERAKELDVPLYESAALARVLYAGVDIDEEIPPEHYKAVATIIGYLWKKNQQKAGGGPSADNMGNMNF